VNATPPAVPPITLEYVQIVLKQAKQKLVVRKVELKSVSSPKKCKTTETTNSEDLLRGC
jgi:hypothetical protein